jgi:hypothetical protein
MFRIKVCAVAFFLLACCVLPMAAQQPAAASANTAVPPMVHFGGVLTETNGKALSGTVGVTFYLYQESQGGAPLWMETQNMMPDKSGHYSVMLGSSSSQGLPSNLFANGQARWLGVQVQGQAEQPRVLLMSVPYALKALDAETIGGKPVSAFQLASPQSKNGGSAGSAAPPADQANEIRCASKTACKTTSIPVFASNGGSAKVSDSIMGQSGSTISVGGSVSASSNLQAGGNVSATGNVSSSNTVSGAFGNFGTTSSGADFVVSNSGTGDVINVFANGGRGVITGGPSYIGLGNATATFPLVGEAPAGSSYGVFGDAATDADFQSAIIGEELGSTTRTIGVEGYTASAIGAGVLGQSVTGSALGSGFVFITGLWGDTGVTGNEGILGTADDGYPLVAQNNSPSGLPTLDLFAFDGTNSSGLLLNALSFGFGGQCIIDVLGNLSCTGVKNAVVPVDGGARKVALNAIEAPENWFEDAGSGQLSNGEAVINLERIFGQTVNTGIDYHVFLTPNGDCRGLYVAQKSATSFVVREMSGGTSSIAFDYRIMAKRKGYEQIRLADKTREFEQKNPNSVGGHRMGGKVHMAPKPPDLSLKAPSSLHPVSQASKR